MGDYAFLLTIALALFGGAISPGPSFLVVAQHSLSLSRPHGIAVSVGTGCGAAVFAWLACSGVSALLEAQPTLYNAFQIFGGCYLLWLAYRLCQAARNPLQTSGKIADHPSLMSCVLKGFMVQISNPKTVLIIASIFAAALPDQLPSYTVLYATMIAFVVDFLWYAIVAMSLSKPSSREFYQRNKRYFDGCAALVLTALAIKLFL